MEDQLSELRHWMSHGTPRQFYTEIAYKITPHGFVAEIDGDKVTCYRIKRQGGFLGLGAREIKTPVLVVERRGEEVFIDEEHADPEFVALLISLLQAH
ncbi:MAG: hypothetical protein ABFD20_06420 [Anaerolineales bacterium]